MKSSFHCPACNQMLSAEELKDGSWQIGCDNQRCSSDVAQKDGGSGKTKEDAYRSLLNAVDNECEQEMDIQAKRERDEEAMADRQMDRERSGGA